MEKHLQSLDDSFSIYDSFDMFAGSSIGAYIVMPIALQKKTACEIKDDIFVQGAFKRMMDESLWDDIIGLAQHKPKYDGCGKTEILREVLGDISFCDTEKHLIVPAYNISKRTTNVFYSNDCDENLLAREVADAASAAPAYFPATSITVDGITDWFIDGGITVNNPSICAISHAYNLIKSSTKRKIVLINVGTGIKNKSIIGKDAVGYGGIEWLLHDIIGISMDESVVHVQTALLLQNHTYIKVTSLLSGISESIDDCSDENVRRLQELGETWWNTYKDEIVSLFHSE